MKAVVVGATSAVGHCLVEALARSSIWEQIVVVVRKQTVDFDAIAGVEKVVQRVLPSLDELHTLESELGGFDAMFCSLGAYMKLDGPELTEKVDYNYVVASADLAVKCGIESFSLVSAGGADAKLPEDSKGFKLYLRIKGRAEEAVLAKNGIKRIYVYKPGILFGRFSATRTSSVRSKGSWDSMVACVGCCCCCLVAKLGVRIQHLASVMVSMAESQDAASKVLDNAAIVNFAC